MEKGDSEKIENEYNPQRIPPVFVNHGGGPLPLLNDENHLELITSLKSLPKLIPRPKAILVVSAHWEEKSVTLLKTKNPKLFFDYGGFPDETYQYEYPAPLAEELNSKIEKLFSAAEIKIKSDTKRFFDHGVFVPLMLMYPHADIPVTQISISSSLDLSFHFQLGQVLAPLSEEGVLILASGMTFHNMGGFFNPSEKLTKANLVFHSYIKDALTNTDFSEEERKNKLINIKSAPGDNFRLSHPREEHLVPFLVAAGAGNRGKAYIQEFEAMSYKLFNVIF